MKKILNILITVLAINLSSCDDGPEPVIYTGDASSERTFLSLDKSSYDLEVAINDVGDTEVILYSSTASSQDRTYTVNLDAEATTANTDAFTLPTSITIAADSYKGSMTISAEDITSGDVDETVYQIVFTLGNLANVDMDIKATYDEDGVEMYHDYSEPVIVNMYETCPVDGSFFVGTYIMDDTSAFPNYSSAQEVVVSVGASSTDRVFETTFLPTTSVAGPQTVNLSLVCGKIAFKTIETTIFCSRDSNGDPISIVLGNADENNLEYDVTDDSSFVVNYIDDVNGSCGASSLQSLTFTKK
ncbi:MAG: hypothetical protein ACPH12_03405 [Flavobacteriaceae bacterium]